MDRRQIKVTILVVVVAAAAAGGVTRYYFPKVEFKNVEIVKEVVKNDIRTVIKEVVRQDGAKEVVTEIVDRTIRTEARSTETIIAAKNQWMFDIGARRHLDQPDLIYELHVQRRILGPFFLGARASTDRTMGLTIGMEF